jgi:hypothetical protein
MPPPHIFGPQVGQMAVLGGWVISLAHTSFNSSTRVSLLTCVKYWFCERSMASILKLPSVSSRFSLGARGSAKLPDHGLCAGYSGFYSAGQFWFPGCRLSLGALPVVFVLLQIVPSPCHLCSW